MLAARLRHKLRNVGDQFREDLGNVAGDERGRGSGFNRVRCHRVNHLHFQLDQFRGRFDDDAREAQVLVRHVVVFESFQLQAGHLGAGEDFADGGIHFVKILGEDETLHQGDVRAVRGVERETLRKYFEQAFVYGLRMLNHRRIRLQQDVDGGDSVRVGFVSRRLGGFGGGATGDEGQQCEVGEGYQSGRLHIVCSFHFLLCFGSLVLSLAKSRAVPIGSGQPACFTIEGMVPFCAYWLGWVCAFLS